MPKFYFSFFIFIILSKALSAQTQVKLIDVDFRQAGITQIVDELKTKTGYHFYYDPARFDSLKITLALSNKPLDTVLNKMFAHSSYRYFINGEREVILTRDAAISAVLAPGFFDDKEQDENAHQQALVNEYSDGTEKKAVEATTENKIYEIGAKTNTLKTGKAILAGYVRDIKSGEPVVGASIYDAETKIGTATDQFGSFSLALPRGARTLSIKALGMTDTKRRIALYSDGKLNIELQEQVTSLKEVKISEEKVANVRSVEMGVNKLDIRSIKVIPTAFGEADVLRVVLSLPGVQSVGEATTGFNVRGGAVDQNLILLNDATIYNPSHFFGFFSAFNPDIVKDIELYKSSIPEKYGGRISSVLDVTNREGNKKLFTGSAGIGLLTSRFNIEGPIVKDKTSFIFGGRTTYSDWLLKLLPEAYKHSSATFYDFNLDISHQIDDKNNIYITTYLSKDNFRLNSDTTYGYSNKNANIKWKHNYNNKLYSVFTAGIDDYQYDITSAVNPIDAYKLNFEVRQTNFKADFTYYLNSKNTIDFGLSSIYYKVNPGDNEPDGAKSLVASDVIPIEHALESAVYLGDKFDITPDLSLSAGIRYSLYADLGPQTVAHYLPNTPRSTGTVTDSTSYTSNQVINTYHAPDIRVAARYIITDDFSVKASFNTLHQFIHLLSNTTAVTPTDVWKLSDPNIKPQSGSQASLGFYKNFSSNTIETSVEAYYKRIHNYLDYASGATILLNQHIETDVVPTEGKAYGIEFLVKKSTGQLNGWVSYAYSRTFLRQNNPEVGLPINNGDYYPANYDKPHSFNFVGNYRFSHRYSASLNTIYSTGRPITYPVGEYYYDGAERVLYSDRNQYRIPDYFRMDFSVNIDGNHKVHQFFHSSWTFGVYNLTGRHNAYSTFFAEQGGTIQGYKLSIFARPIPFVNYNIKF